MIDEKCGGTEVWSKDLYRGDLVSLHNFHVCFCFPFCCFPASARAAYVISFVLQCRYEEGLVMPSYSLDHCCTEGVVTKATHTDSSITQVSQQPQMRIVTDSNNFSILLFIRSRINN